MIIEKIALGCIGYDAITKGVYDCVDHTNMVESILGHVSHTIIIGAPQTMSITQSS